MLSMNVAVERGDKERLQEIAEQLGAIAPGGRMKGMPSVSELLRQIASGRLRVVVISPADEAWEYIELCWNACAHNPDEFMSMMSGATDVTAIWPLNCDRVQALINS